MKIRTLLLIPALGATLLLAACSGDDYSGDNDESAGANSASRDSASPGQSLLDNTGLTSESGKSASSAAPSGGDGGDDALPSSSEYDRKIVFTAKLSLEAGEVAGAFDRAASLVRSNGGYLQRSSFSNAADEVDRTASLTIRVPVQNYESLLASLRTLEGGRVLDEGSESTEVTEQYTDLQSRLRNLQSTESQYLLLLKEAKTIQEILTVQDRLSGVRSQIEQIQGRLKVLDSLTEFATIEVRIYPVAAKLQEPSGGLKLSEVWAESWEQSVEVARYVAAGAMIGVVALAWLIVPIGILVFVVRRANRHRPTPPVTPEPAA